MKIGPQSPFTIALLDQRAAEVREWIEVGKPHVREMLAEGTSPEMIAAYVAHMLCLNEEDMNKEAVAFIVGLLMVEVVSPRPEPEEV